MILPLKGEELVDGGDGRGIGGLQAQLPTAGQGVGNVPDPGPAGGHHSRAGDITVVHESRESKVPPRERCRNPAHMRSDLGHSGGVGGVALKADTAPVGERLESMGGGVLIHPHGGMAAVLDQCKGTVGGIGSGRPCR
jgi:hypothetical protein